MVAIRNIIFDLGGVIINLNDDEYWLQNYMSPLLGLEALDAILQARIFEQFEVGQMKTDEFYAILKSKSTNTFNLEQLKTAWNSKLLDIPVFRIDLLYQLSLHYNLYLLSNTNTIHIEFIKALLLGQFNKAVFQEVFKYEYYSHILKQAKPHRQIYETVLSDSNLTASETLFIDDNKINLEQPKNLGLSAIHFQNDEQFRNELTTLLK